MSEGNDPSRPAYLDRYDPEDEGLRYMPGAVFQYGSLPPLPDGILGERLLGQNLKTDIMARRLTIEDVRRPDFTVDELNDMIIYTGWSIWDQLSLRASEGRGGMMPRPEYEALTFASCFYRWPEFARDMIDRLGIDGLVELGRSGREPANKINQLHAWGLPAAWHLGRALFIIMGHNKPDEYLPEMNAIMKFWQAIAWGYRGDGYVFSEQDRYRTAALDPEWTERLESSLQPLQGSSAKQFTSLMAASELLSFYVHLDCRLGMYDLGPFVQPNGNAVIVRSTFFREEGYSWSMFSEGLPYAMTFAFEIDTTKMAAEELRVLSIGTLMSRPRNYIGAIIKGSVWVRDEWDSEIREVSLEDATAQYFKPVGDATGRVFEWMTRTPRRHLIENGAFVYSVGIMLPFMRKAGVYEEYCEKYGLWELDERVARVYYELDRNDFARITLPTRLFTSSETSLAPISADAKLWRSKYSYT